MRLKLPFILIFFVLLVAPASAQAARPVVEIETSMGIIRVELASYRAPATVQNFLKYVKSGFYDNTVFHRIEPNFVIQGGGYDFKYEYKETTDSVKNESDNGLENKRGTIAMARTDDVHSANSQFYFNLSDNRSLDAKYGRLGYTVFGKVLQGMDVVDAISNVKTGAYPGIGNTAPVSPVLVRTIKIIETKSETKSKK